METVTIQISKTSDGLHDYMQITSPDQTSLNIVLIVNHINLEDRRPREKKKKE
jgi:hypothetical protein